jgi:hypothetical protein
MHLRWNHRLGPVGIGDRLGLANASALRHESPGDLVQFDVQKLRKVPDGGGRCVARRQGDDSCAAAPGKLPSAAVTPVAELVGKRGMGRVLAELCSSPGRVGAQIEEQHFGEIIA